MAIQNLVQQYMYSSGKHVWVNFPLNKEMGFCLLRNGTHAQAVYSEFNAYAKIEQSKLRKAYAAWSRNENGISCYIRWPKENIIFKWGDYYDVQSAKNSINWNAIDKMALLPWNKVVEINKIENMLTPAEAWTIAYQIRKAKKAA